MGRRPEAPATRRRSKMGGTLRGFAVVCGIVGVTCLWSSPARAQDFDGDGLLTTWETGCVASGGTRTGDTNIDITISPKPGFLGIY